MTSVKTLHVVVHSADIFAPVLWNRSGLERTITGYCLQTLAPGRRAFFHTDRCYYVKSKKPRALKLSVFPLGMASASVYTELNESMQLMS